MRHSYLIVIFLLSISWNMNAQQHPKGHYADINELKMYYEIHGEGSPLVLLHGGGSTIESTFGRILPTLAKKHRVIAVELQAHGRTSDRDRPLTFESDADDVAALLKHLGIPKAGFMGFSNGGTTCLQIAIRHPSIVDKLIVASAIYQREAMPAGFFEGMQKVRFEDMPPPLKDAFLRVNPDSAALVNSFHRDVARMLAFKDIDDAAIKKIQAPVLVINGDADVVSNEHALKLSRTLPNAHLLILPGVHGEYIGEICSPHPESKTPILVTEVIEEFLR
ncbi:MAG TPA: alpha/beta hydrolase [Bacteroidales bacterium]|nr:alpha/beta hydrolase [Bacteroidales bacterium]